MTWKKELFNFYGIGNIDNENGTSKASTIITTALGGGIGNKLSPNATMSHTASNTKNKTVEIDYTTTVDVIEEVTTTLIDVEEDENSMNASQDTTTINSQNTKPANVTDDSGYVDDTKIPASAVGIKYILSNKNNWLNVISSRKLNVSEREFHRLDQH